MPNKFNFRTVKSGADPEPTPAASTSLADKVAGHKFSIGTTKATAKSNAGVQLSNLPKKQPVIHDTAVPANKELPFDLSELEIPTDEYVWDGQVLKEPEAANSQMTQMLAQLETAFGTTKVDTALHRVLEFLDAHAFLKDNLADEQVGLMVRGLAISTGKVQEKKSGNRKKRAKAEETATEFASELAGLDFG